MNEINKPTFGSSGLALIAMLLTIVFYAWQVQGLAVGIGFGAFFMIAVLVGNYVSISKFESLKWGTYSRWTIFVILMALIAISGAEQCDPSGICEPLL